MANATITETLHDDTYIMGRKSKEYERLHRQSIIWEPITKRILQQAKLQKGMRCLDVGCGTGDVMRLIGDITGSNGSVTGFDLDEKLGFEALQILNNLGNSNYHFVKGDIVDHEIFPGAPYDFIYVRFVLIHMQEPVRVLQKMYDSLKVGGTLLIQDYDLSAIHFSSSFNKQVDYCVDLFLETYIKSSKDPRIGIKLPLYFEQAFSKNADGTDISGLATPAKPAIDMMCAVFESMLPVMSSLGLADEETYNAFCDLVNKALPTLDHVTACWPLLGSAWISKT